MPEVLPDLQKAKQNCFYLIDQIASEVIEEKQEAVC